MVLYLTSLKTYDAFVTIHYLSLFFVFLTYYNHLVMTMQVGRYIYVQITEVDEAKNNLILSEKEAWVSTKMCLFSFVA